MPRPAVAPTHILETCIYVTSMSLSNKFYQDILGLTPSLQTERMAVYPLDNTTLITFQLGLTQDDIHPDDQHKYTIPGHGPTPSLLSQLTGPTKGGSKSEMLKQHFCLGVPSRADVESWEAYFKEQDVPILGVMDWERGGRSVYFADPDGNPGELASPGVWPHY